MSYDRRRYRPGRDHRTVVVAAEVAAFGSVGATLPLPTPDRHHP